ncbi:MAG TPA: phosphate ABC transporter permease PstA [Mycobacteriales bacterium]|nr:phosphate ABC transporter permease PstA [Mycobacteriales bacterium]
MSSLADVAISEARAIPPAPRSRTFKSAGFKLVLMVCLAFGVLALGTLLVDIITTGLPRLNGQLFERFPSSSPRRAGAQSAIMGTLWVISITALFTVPIGVATAVYLEEYADDRRWYNRFLALNIQNLAAVPSIIYGILALGFLVRGIGFGPTVLAGALALTLLVLPIVVLASREALRSVPSGIRFGALALGATQWQMIWRQVLPNAVPGIATGSILALSRAIGEAAPLLLVSGITFITFNPTGLNSAFTVLPLQIYTWVSRPQPEFAVLAAAAIMVLLAILLVMNSLAIFLRNKFQKRW